MRSRRLQACIPPLFLCLGALAILLLWREADQAEQRRRFMETRITAAQIGLRLEAWIDARTSLITFLADNHFAGLPDVATEFPADARRLVNLYPGVQALNFIDRDWVIRIVVPETSNAPALGQDLHRHPSPGVVEALAQAELTGSIARTPVVDLLQGGRGVATYVTLRGTDQQPLGFLNAVFRLDTLLDICIAEPELRERFDFCLIAENDIVAISYPDSLDRSSLVDPASFPVRVVDRPWLLTVAPRPGTASLDRDWAGRVLAAAGLILVAGTVLLLHVLLRRQWALHDSRAEYQLLVENQNELIVKIDTAGRFLYASPSYCETFGKTEAELLGREITSLADPDHPAAAAETLRSMIRPPHRVEIEQHAWTRDGWRWLAWSGAPVLDRNGDVESVVAVGRDVTRHKELEEQLRQSQKMQAIGQLAGGIAHDFNNILQVMRGHLELLFDELRPEGQVRQDLEAVQRSAVRATELTKQVLAFSRQQMLNPVVVDLDEVVVEMLPLLRRLLREAIDLEHRPAGRRLLVRADRGQLEQVLMNLCVNARDAIADTGVITVSTSVRQLGPADCRDHLGLQPGSYVSLEVADTGRGIPAHLHERIYEPFFTTKAVGTGTGLGLATVYGIVRQHGGLVELASEPGHGARFTILLPEATGEPTAAIGGTEPLAPGGPETILVAEDDATVRDLAVRVLEQAGYRVLTASDGQEAIDRHAAAQPAVDLTLLDIVMPHVGGREAATRIRERDPHARLLFVSGYAAQESYPAPDADHLMKPYDAGALLSRVREMLDRVR